MVILIISSMNGLILVFHDSKLFHYDILFFEFESTMRFIHLVPFIPNHYSLHTVILPISIDSNRIFNILYDYVLPLPFLSSISHIPIVDYTSILIYHFVLSIDVFILELIKHSEYIDSILKISPSIHLHFISQLLNTL